MMFASYNANLMQGLHGAYRFVTATKKQQQHRIRLYALCTKFYAVKHGSVAESIPHPELGSVRL
jgi:hypothetical protein